MDEAECRICFEAYSTHEDPLMSPCLCNGTSKWVHKSCIQHWRYVNRNTTAFIQCRECGHPYNVKKISPDETFVFEDANSLMTTSTYWYFFAIGMFSAALIRPIDKHIGYPSVYILTNFKKPKDNLMLFFKNNELYNLQYVFCVTVFYMTAFMYIFTFFRITSNINNKCRYWYHAASQYISIMAISLHFYYFTLVCNGKSKNVEGLLTFETLLSSFNIIFYGALMSWHNRLIEALNLNNIFHLSVHLK